MCPYLKQPIVIGKNASVDHIKPKSKGGTDETSNLQWVHHDVNIMKWDQSHEDFLQRVRLIAKNCCVKVSSEKTEQNTT